MLEVSKLCFLKLALDKGGVFCREATCSASRLSYCTILIHTKRMEEIMSQSVKIMINC